MRFNAPEHLHAWKLSHRYPAIHDNIFQLCSSHMRGLRVLDLCCSTGLLGARVAAYFGADVVGVDADERALNAARAAGLDIHLVHMHVDSFNLAPLENLIQQHQIQTVLARRCLPELFGHDLQAGAAFAQMLHRLKVQEVFIEGRVASKAAVNPLASLAGEVDLLAPHYRVSKLHHNVAFLKRVP